MHNKDKANEKRRLRRKINYVKECSDLYNVAEQILNSNCKSLDLDQPTTEVPSHITECENLGSDVQDSQNPVSSTLEHESSDVNYIPETHLYNFENENEPPPYETSSDEDDVNDDLTFDLEDMLRRWKHANNVTLSALSSLLSILQSYFPALPKDARTLLNTPHVSPVRILGNGKFVYFGLKIQLEQHALSVNDTTMKLFLNIDGLPLFKSSKMEFWPILAQVCNSSIKKPIIVGIYCGNGKPPIKDYLSDFVCEVKVLYKHGINTNQGNFKVIISALICDAPARNFIKCTIGFNAYGACEKCLVWGEHHGCVVFLDINCALRTDEEFCDGVYLHYQTGKSPFLELGIGLVSQVVLDPMHLIHLGVTRRLLYLLRSGSKYCKKSIAHLALMH
jgi:hypothetical protein